MTRQSPRVVLLGEGGAPVRGGQGRLSEEVP